MSRGNTKLLDLIFFGKAGVVHPFLVKVLKQPFSVVGGIGKRCQNSGLHVVGVVSGRPIDHARCGVWTVPLSRSYVVTGVFTIGEVAQIGVGSGITEGFVKTAHRVVCVSYPNAISGPPSVVKGPVKYSGKPLCRKAGHLVIRNGLPLANGNGVNIVVVGPRSGRDIEQRHRFVKVEHDVGVPFVVNFKDVFGDRLRDLKPVSIVIVKNVFTPIRS